MRNSYLVSLSSVLCFSSALFAAAPALIIDLDTASTSALTRIYGRGLEDEGTSGLPVTGGFDCDGDGHLDYAFAQMKGDPLGRIDAGEVTLIFGDGTIGGTIDSAVRHSRVLRIAGTQLSETTGDEIWMDDVDGDGLGDLLIGRQNHTPHPNRRGAGALTILFGSPELRTFSESLNYLDLSKLPPDVKTITLWGASAYDRLGIWMRTGDITGDGVSDLIVAADEVDGLGFPVSYNRGAVYIVRGGSYLKEAAPILDLAAFGTEGFPDEFKGNVAQIDPPAGSQNYHFGGTVQLADLDGNSRADVLVAATLSRSGANLRLPNAPGGTGQASGGSIDGTVFIIWDESFPPTPWPNAYRFSAMSPPMGTFTRIDGDPLYSNFGEEMLGGLDFSGDGFAELFVGDLIASPEGRIAAGIGYVIYNAANLKGLSFRINAPPTDVFVTTIFGPRPSAIGGDTAAQGDFDGDGINDLAFGIPGDSPQQRAKAGSLHLFYGQPGGWPEFVNLRPDTNGFQDVYPSPQIMRIAEIQGAHGTEESNTGDTLGYSGTAADIDRDGRTDLIINEMVGDGTTVPDVGNLLLISGAGLLNKPSFNLELSEAGPIRFGSHDMDKGEGEEQTVSVTNTSSTNQVINSIIIEGPNAGDFSIISQSPGSILASGEVKFIVINFNPASAGFKGAAVVIRTKLNTIPLRIGLTGSGVQNNAVSGQLRIQRTETDIALQFDSDSELNYFLQSSDDLKLWLTRSITPGTGSEVNVYYPNAVEPANSELFYRLLATP